MSLRTNQRHIREFLVVDACVTALPCLALTTARLEAVVGGTILTECDMARGPEHLFNGPARARAQPILRPGLGGGGCGWRPGGLRDQPYEPVPDEAFNSFQGLAAELIVGAEDKVVCSNTMLDEDASKTRSRIKARQPRRKWSGRSDRRCLRSSSMHRHAYRSRTRSLLCPGTGCQGLGMSCVAKMRRNWGTNWDNHLQGRQLPLARDAWKENTLHWPHTAVSSVNSDSPRFTYVISPRPFCRPSLHALTSGLARKQRLVTRRQQRHHLLPGRPLHPSIAPIRRRAATSIARAPSQTDTAREPSARERRPPPTMVQDMPPKGGYEPVQYKVRGGFGLR